MSSILAAVLVFCVIASAFTGCWRYSEQQPVPDQHEQHTDVDIERLLPFGNPSNATAEWLNSSNYLLIKHSFAISYNNARATANWAAWRVTKGDLGESLQRPSFEPDAQLPIGFTRASPSDYSGSGYDRGHLVPAADRFGDPAGFADTFRMTNIVPQTSELNQFPWEKLESYTRAIVRRNNDAYVIAGVYGDKGRLNALITVPTNCWKIIMVLPAGASAADVTVRTRVIAVDMPNSDQTAPDNWRKYLTTVDAIEAKTGFDFFSVLSEELQYVLESRIDNYRGAQPRPSR